MISVEEAKLILQDERMTDGDVKETIDALQLLVELMFDKIKAERKAAREKNNAEKIENITTEETKTLKKKTDG